MVDSEAAMLARAMLELKKHVEVVEARAVCAELLIDALVRTHPDVPKLLEEWSRPLSASESDAARSSPAVQAAFERRAQFVRMYTAR